MDTKAIEKKGRIYLLAYDQGMEHGPSDFNEDNYHPNQIVKIALETDASCITMQYGMAKRYYDKSLRRKLPLILKLNGKTRLNSANYTSALLATPADAKALGAVGVGFTIYPGSENESHGLAQFAEIRRECEKLGLITVVWAYARGPEIKDQYDKDVIAYAIRTAAEIGADVVKCKYPGDPKSFAFGKKMGAGIKVVASGTGNFPDDYFREIGLLMKAGIDGVAVGRNVWQNTDPINFGKKLAAKIYHS